MRKRLEDGDGWNGMIQAIRYLKTIRYLKRPSLYPGGKLIMPGRLPLRESVRLQNLGILT